MSIVGTILLRSALIFLVLGCITGLVAGAALILRPDLLARAGRIANRWISTRRFDRWLEIRVEVDSFFNRFRLAASVLMLAGAVYILYFFGMRFDEADAMAVFEKVFRGAAAYIELLFDPLKAVVLAGAVFAAILSLLLLFFPGRFHRLEHGANEWLSLRREMKPLEITRNSMDEFAFHYSRQIGTLLVLGSIYTLVMFSIWAR